MGKGWAKGLSAKTDPRVARMATARRGKQRGPYRGRRTQAWEWTPEIAYAVGLIATDGNLSGSGRHISVTSAERDVLETFLECIDRRAKISKVKGGYGTEGLRVQIGDVGLYRWLQSVGLTPRKSLTLGAIKVPDTLLAHLLRGLIDGDGSILDVTYDGTGKARGRRYRTLLVRFTSASRDHVD
jgi:intein/homing endonuclease